MCIYLILESWQSTGFNCRPMLGWKRDTLSDFAGLLQFSCLIETSDKCWIVHSMHTFCLIPYTGKPKSKQCPFHGMYTMTSVDTMGMTRQNTTQSSQCGVLPAQGVSNTSSKCTGREIAGHAPFHSDSFVLWLPSIVMGSRTTSEDLCNHHPGQLVINRIRWLGCFRGSRSRNTTVSGVFAWGCLSLPWTKRNQVNKCYKVLHICKYIIRPCPLVANDHFNWWDTDQKVPTW